MFTMGIEHNMLLRVDPIDPHQENVQKSQLEKVFLKHTIRPPRFVTPHDSNPDVLDVLSEGPVTLTSSRMLR